jgi:hypothetical protein
VKAGPAALVFELRKHLKVRHRVKHTGEEIGRAPPDDCATPANHSSDSDASGGISERVSNSLVEKKGTWKGGDSPKAS